MRRRMKRRKKLIETRNQAESLIYLAEKSMRMRGISLPADIKTGMKEKLEALKKAKETEDIAAIKAATEALSAEIQKIGQAAYNKANGPQASDGGSSRRTAAKT